VFVDEHLSRAGQENWRADQVAERRRPQDGSTYRIVKTYLDPRPFADRLAALGWQADIRRLGRGWVLGQATPATR
jgi:hypothetical protein